MAAPITLPSAHTNLNALASSLVFTLAVLIKKNFFFLAVPHGCGILVHLLGAEPGASPVKAQSLNHWTAREFFECSFLLQDLCI